MSALLSAAVECVEEAIRNSLCRATTMDGRDRPVLHDLPLEALGEIAF